MRVRRRTIPLLAAALALSGCGSSSGAPSPPAAPSHSPPPVVKQALIAILQATGAGSHAALPPLPSANDTVTLLDLSGASHGSASFTPRVIPSVGPAMTLLQPEGQIAAGRVFYVDGTGTVRALTPGGSPTVVAVFPITSGSSALSFAVSPDGANLMASALLLTPNTPTGTMRLLTSTSGGTASTLYQQPFTGAALQMVGWDSTGPIALAEQPLGSQFGNRGRRWFATASYLSAQGTPGNIIGGSGCYAWEAPRSGRVICLDQLGNGPVTVRDAAGAVVFSVTNVASDGSFALSPDGTRVAYTSEGHSPGPELLDAFVVDEQNLRVRLPNDFAPQGWIDDTHVVGVTFPNGTSTSGASREEPGNLAYVDLASPSLLHDLGVKGSFLGTI